MTALQLKQELIKRGKNPQASMADINVLLEALRSGKYNKAHQTTLYKKHTNEYVDYTLVLGFWN